MNWTEEKRKAVSREILICLNIEKLEEKNNEKS